MAEYDSDSSLEDNSEYTETGVLLGYATKESTDDTISHLGGHPVSPPQTPGSTRHVSDLNDTGMARSKNATIRLPSSMQMLSRLYVPPSTTQRRSTEALPRG